MRVPGALALLPGLLQGAPGGPGGDFYVAYHTVQLLTALGAGNMPRLQEVRPQRHRSCLVARQPGTLLLCAPCFLRRSHASRRTSKLKMWQALLAAPLCIARLMDFLGSEHEVLRNEALLLLVGLARASADIQKIVVFEGAFERALGIARHAPVATHPHHPAASSCSKTITVFLSRSATFPHCLCGREEGGTEGGIVVQDCLELLNNLLRTSATNQLMFRSALVIAVHHVLFC